MPLIKESDFITNKEIKRIIEGGCGRQFYCGWEEYKDSYYHKYAVYRGEAKVSEERNDD